MYKINYSIFNIEYPEKDKDFSIAIINSLKDNYLEIMNFFNLKEFDKNITIKFWDNVEDYHGFFNEKLKKYNKQVPDWEIARSSSDSNCNRIDILCLSEIRKCRGHNNESVEDLIKVGIHEFVHSCYFSYNHHNESMTWLSEGLATYFAGQYGEYRNFDCSLEDIINGNAKYFNYHNMGKYLIENYDKEYILKLARDKELSERDTKDIYLNTVDKVKSNNKIVKL